ncbi:hypothetical protein [Gimesia aquarii]|nr:hypothetical protein [Gimesia aquarii]
MSGGVRLNKPAYCPYCADPVSGEAVTLWDDRVYCRKCVKDVSPELFEFVTNGGRLEETVEKSDISLKKYFKGAGKKTVAVAFIIFMLPFLVLANMDKVNAKIDLLIGCSFFCGGFVLGYIFLKLLLASHRRSLPRTVTVESGQLLVIRPQDEIRFPLAECKWKFGGIDRDGLTYFTGLQKGITINHSGAFISCGHSPEMLKYWGAFLILAGVRRKSYWDALRILLISIAGTLIGFLAGWCVGHIVALFTNDPLWPFAMQFLGTFDGFGTAFNYAYYTSYGAKAAHKRLHPGFLGGAFLIIGVKVCIFAGPLPALICGGINGVLGVIVAWCCRSWIENRELQGDTEVTGLVQRQLIELSEIER